MSQISMSQLMQMGTCGEEGREDGYLASFLEKNNKFAKLNLNLLGSAEPFIHN